MTAFLDPFFKNEWLEALDLTEIKKFTFISSIKQQLLVEMKNLKNRNSSQEIEVTIETNQTIDVQSGNFESNSNRRPLSTISTESDTSLLRSPTKRRKFFTFINKNNIQKQTENNEDIIFKRQIDEYLSIEYDPEVELNSFWLRKKSKFPDLYELALKFLSIPASSGPVERIFSYSGYINRPHRSRLTTKNLEITTL